MTRFVRIATADADPVGISLLACRLLTGRTHQIRVHLAASGWPIVGDPAYGAPRWADLHDAGLARVLESFSRQALHAWRVTLAHPATGIEMCLEAPLPTDLKNLLGAINLPDPSSCAPF